MFVFWKARKSIGSGALDQQAPKTSGQRSASHSDDQPPEECPVTMRASGRASRRKLASRCGISSSTSAVPRGP
jgi:hypothetical protein